MKKLLYLLLLIVANCQQKQSNQSTTPPAAAVATTLEKASSPTVESAAPATLTPEGYAMLQHIRLAPLFLAPAHKDSKMVLDGFFGTNPQRLSLAILQAHADSVRPDVIHVAGKTRNQKKITSFTGTLQLTSIADYYSQDLLLSQGEEEFNDDTTGGNIRITNARAYSAVASFHLVGNAPAAYLLTGQVLLDFWAMDNGKVGVMYASGQGEILKEAPTKGSGLVVKGNWQNLQDHKILPFLVSSNIFHLSPGLIKDFGIGDRNSQVNPKYARLGWSNYWENDEWWADSPKPSMNL